MISSAGARGRGRRAGLTRDRVVDAAVAAIDRDGIDGFSLRRLAGELDVDPMSIYNHVANKDALLDAVVERVMSGIVLDRDPRIPWQDQIRGGAAAFRDVALAHPQVAVLMLTRRVLTAVPLRLMREAVAPVLSVGVPVTEAVDVVRTFTAFLTGSILRELGSGLSLAGVDADRAGERARDLGADPLLAAAAAGIAEIDHRALFDYGVELLIAGVEARVPASTTRSSG